MLPDHSSMDGLDPFLTSQANSTLIYTNCHKCSIFISQKPGSVQKLPNEENLIVKVVVFGSIENPRGVSIELTSDSELDFNFQFSCNDLDFRRIREIQNYMIQFREYPEVILQNFQKLGSNNSKYIYEASFTIFTKTEGKFEIIRRSQFKNDCIMEFDFHRSSEEHIRNSIQYRYDLMKKQFTDNYAKYKQYRQIIKAKNPSLLLQIDKTLKKK